MHQPERSRTRGAGNSQVILVVADEVLIAMEIEAVLVDEGFRVLGPAASVEEALEILADHAPAAAVLDVNLRGELVSPVAEALRLKQIPFLVTSAHYDPVQVAGAAVSGVPHLGKPTSPVHLVASLHMLLS